MTRINVNVHGPKDIWWVKCKDFWSLEIGEPGRSISIFFHFVNDPIASEMLDKLDVLISELRGHLA